MIRPVLEYGAEVWTRREEGLLEGTEMRMLRWILGVKKISLVYKHRLSVLSYQMQGVHLQSQ